MPKPHQENINGHEFWMLPVEGGDFEMGSQEGAEGAYDDEYPQHRVSVSSFYLGQYPVTQALWKLVMNGDNPSHFQGDERPVEQVSWEEAQGFLQKLNDLTQTTRPKAHFYSLPTEAEWEYAARGGPYHTDGYRYAGSDRLKEVGWFNENSDNETKPVGLKYPNQLGLYDMSGNVYEWCEDDWHGNYEAAPTDGSAWTDNPRVARRVLRGGSWLNASRGCRAAYRNTYEPDHRYGDVGFRLALVPQSVGRSFRPAFARL